MEVGCAKKSYHNRLCTHRNLVCFLSLDGRDADGRTGNAYYVAYACAVGDTNRVEHIHRRTVGHTGTHEHAKPDTDAHRDA